MTPRNQKYRRQLPWLIAAFLALLLLFLIGTSWWRSSGVGSQVQVPMFYDAHYLFPRAWTQEQAAPGVPEPALIAFYGPNRISQSFVSGSDQLSMVEIWLAGQENAAVTVSIMDDQGGNVSGEITLTEGLDGGIYNLSFDPILNAKDRQFTLSMIAPDSTIEKPVTTRMVGGDRLGGSIYLNEYNRPGNLAISTYARGLPGIWWLEAVGEQILPSLFRLRLQQYKPTLFKGVFFTFLLLVTVSLTIMYLVLARPQVKPSIVQLRQALGWTVVLVLILFLIWQMADGRMKFRPTLTSSRLERSNNTVGKAPPPGSRARLTRDLVSDLWTTDRLPEERLVISTSVESMPAIRVPADSQITYDIAVPPSARFRTGIAAIGQGEIDAQVNVGSEMVHAAAVTAVSVPGTDDINWLEVDLRPWSGQPITLKLTTESTTENLSGLWIMPQIDTSSDWLLPDPLPTDLAIEDADFTYGDRVRLVGYNLNPSKLTAGDTVKVGLYWLPLRETSSYAKVFIHLIDDQGQLVAQRDAQPVNNSYPIPVWQPGSIILDEHALELPSDLPSGEYTLSVGLYDPDSLKRWPITGADGITIPDERVDLATIIEVSP